MCNARFCTTQEDPRPGFMGGEAEQRASERGRILSSRWAWGLARDQLSAAKPCAGRGTPHCAGMEGSKGRLAKEGGSTEKRGQLRELSTRTMTKSVQA